MDDQAERISTELSLLETMYPGQVQYVANARELRYTSTGGTLVLRLPNGYLNQSADVPEVLSASAGKQDLREPLKQRIAACPTGEEVLDSVISGFDELAEGVADRAQAESDSASQGGKTADSKATVIVWLHHLLNTNKRKLALSPSLPGVSGVTKPGYPGVLLYSGPATAVHEHVNELKQQNWQAFQIRLEDDEEWLLSHGTGVVEVEAMKEVVAEVGKARKDVFLEAMRMNYLTSLYCFSKPRDESPEMKVSPERYHTPEGPDSPLSAYSIAMAIMPRAFSTIPYAA
ncbi:hypothetical protein B0A55_04687 [Friedmanniomyces simplex]|uniref:RWD domain-containing protein n=1 Tax=Friedmanniomyces simplex TaxID=329884 RepID=A0A4U0XQ91_9PEZI|nr:hypothetical protein B0A55_04687 [Friedmanniomyces simplex]